MIRQLVTVRKILKLEAIPDADRIEIAKIGGWQCVVKKGEFKESDLGIYFEIDSFLPLDERYEFLRKSSYKKLVDGTEGFRLKTAKFKKKLSQGLMLPLTMFPEITNPTEGQDYSEILNVTKYEPPIPAQLSGVVKGMFPSFIQKTDQERIQNLTEYFEIHKDTEFEETEKLDGTSTTYYVLDSEFGVCSRNLEFKEEGNLTQWTIAKEIGLKEDLAKINKNVALQGEIIGEGIQKNPYKIQGQEFYLYDIYDIDNKRLMNPLERKDFLEQLDNPKIKHVPIINKSIKIFQETNTIEEMMEYAKGKSKLNPESEREGVVFKSYLLDNNRIISFKTINNEYLLNEPKNTEEN